MKKKKIIKKCIICGYLGALIFTHSGFTCKKCLHDLHNNLHLPHGGMSYDWPINDYISRSAIEATVTSVDGTITIDEMPIKYIDIDEK